MMRQLIAIAIAFVGCDETSGECRTRLDCGQDEHCFADPGGEHGACVPMLGYTPTPPLEISAAQRVRDLLLVVDDGPGSAELQRRLVAALPTMVAAAQSTRLRLRIAVTTATVVGPFCDSRAFARSGRFAATSCLDRLDDFIAEDGADDRAICTDACSRTTADLHLEANRPWVAIEATTNANDVIETLACLVPQGTSGCARSSPLGAIELAALREADEAEAEHGFFRDSTWPDALVVTDGMDCTTTEIGQAAFDPAGARTLWPETDADVAPPAVCWSAGVECEGTPPIYDDCEQANLDLEGKPTHVTTSVLAPYGTSFGAIIDIAVIGGVPVEGDLVYSTRDDAEFVAEHGIAPGCDDGVIRAVPPLRLDAHSLAIDSVCAPTYDEPLLDAGNTDPIGLCFEPCDAQNVEVLAASVASGTEVPRCEGDAIAPSIPDDASACHLWVPQSAGCTQGRTELVVRTRQIGNTGSVWLSPNPFARSTPSCGD